MQRRNQGLLMAPARCWSAALASAAALALTSGCGVNRTDSAPAAAPERAAPADRGRETADPIQRATTDVMERARPAVVRIEAVLKNYAGGREIKTTGTGTGFIMTREGHVLSNHHVAGNSSKLVCFLFDNEKVDAELVGTDALADVAVLKLAPRPGRPYPCLPFGDSSAVVVGETVLAVGSPLAMSQTATRGAISNTKMIMPGSLRGFTGFTLDGEEVGSLVRWFTHDALILPGNSGGPLLNLKGEVIGVNEISYGLSGAIPGNLARAVGEQIIREGRVRRAWLGLEAQPLLEGSGLDRGILVGWVAAGSPAAKAGIVAGDVLLCLAGRETTLRFDEELPVFNQQVAALPIGANIEAILQRAGTNVSVTMQTVEREPMLTASLELKEWAITARNLNAHIARELRIGEAGGVLVTSLSANGPGVAAKPPLQPLDVIRRVNSQAVESVTQLRELTRKTVADAAEPVPVLVELDRQGQSLLAVVRLGIRPPVASGSQAHKAWMAIQVQAIGREMAAQLGSNQLAGVRITRVHEGSTAAAAGLRVGDLVVALDGKPLGVSAVGEEAHFFARLRTCRIGSTGEFAVVRNGVATNIPVAFESSPAEAEEMEKYQDVNFEFVARDLSFDDRVRLGLPADLRGTLVTEVTQGGWAALGGLASGDLILEVAGEPTGSAPALGRVMRELATRRPNRIVVRVRRGIQTRYLELQAEWPNDTPAGAGTNKTAKGTQT
jgi:serine protease Do